MLGKISEKDGLKIIEYQAFESILKLIIFWKMVRLDNIPTPDNVGHWVAFRNMRRNVLFGTSDPPEDKTAVNL